MVVSKNWFIVLSCLILVILAFIFARSLEQPSTDTTEVSLEKVSCRLKWLPQAQFAGNFVAVAKGFYRNVGIECSLIPGGQDFNAIKLVASGSDDFGICGADQILIARSKGISVIALAVIYQKSPVCFFSKKGSGISKPADFIGKKVAMQYGTNVRTEYVAMMNKQGIGLSKVIEIPSRYDIQRFFEGEVDVWNGYMINEVLVAQENDIDVNVIMPADYGVDMYADCLFTTEDMLRNNPDFVRRFVSATIRGWYHAIEHQEEGVRIVLAQDSKLKADHERKMLLASIPLILSRSAKEKGIGWMDGEVWQEMEQILYEQGVIKKRVKVSSAYTNEFLYQRQGP